ncbi:MAG TPA: ABC transporter permease [Streptosporangiaceae bacterium]|jgi:putative ABC transport system permease protein
MSPGQVLRFALAGLASNKLRSALTCLGILIGVGSVILLVAVGNGSSQAIQASLNQLGTNSLTVLHEASGSFLAAGSASGAQSTQDLTLTDAQDLSQASGVESASPVVSTSQSLTYGGNSATTSIEGTYPSYFQASDSPIASGRYLSNSDVTSARKVLVIGATTATDLFGTGNPVGQNVDVAGVPFTVIGVLKAKGSSGLQSADTTAIAPLTTVQEALTGYGSLNDILVEAQTPALVNSVESEITAILDKAEDVTSSTQANFEILNQSQLLTASTSTSHTFTVLLGAVAAISLLVGGIGITNIMLVTVTERTREIGIRKAIGAPPGVILAQFLAEATLLSLIGGALGVIGGLIGTRFTIVGVKPVAVPASIALAFGVSLLIGLFFGGYPANRAANMRPVEALRYE